MRNNTRHAWSQMMMSGVDVTKNVASAQMGAVLFDQDTNGCFTRGISVNFYEQRRICINETRWENGI
jgi:hypothetical protein